MQYPNTNQESNDEFRSAVCHSPTVTSLFYSLLNLRLMILRRSHKCNNIK